LALALGRHKDPRALDFIDSIVKLGKSFGLFSVDEYSMFDNSFDVDIVWKFDDKTPPLATFQVETKARSSMFKNIAKVFDTPSDVVPKPLFHYILILNGMLTKGQEASLSKIRLSYNIKIYVDILNKDYIKNLLYEDLYELVHMHNKPQNRLVLIEEKKQKFQKYLDEYFIENDISKLINYRDFLFPITQKILDMVKEDELNLVPYAVKILINKIYNVNFYAYEDDVRQIKNPYFYIKDIFYESYSHREILLKDIIRLQGHELLDAWTERNVEKADVISELLLYLSLDFIKKDFNIVEKCFEALDDAASDFFIPEILSRAILIAALIQNYNYQLNVVEKFCDAIIENDEFSLEAGYFTYLRDSLYEAEGKQEKFNIDITFIKDSYILPKYIKRIKARIIEFIEYFAHDKEGNEDYIYDNKLLREYILAYEHIVPSISDKIKELIYKTNDKRKILVFEEIIACDPFLNKIYQNDDDMTTFNNFLLFLENISKYDCLEIGPSITGMCIINFYREINKDKENNIISLLKQYKFDKGYYDLDGYLSIELDYLYLYNNTEYTENLKNFFLKLNNIIKIKEICPSINFRFRDKL